MKSYCQLSKHILSKIKLSQNCYYKTVQSFSADVEYSSAQKSNTEKNETAEEFLLAKYQDLDFIPTSLETNPLVDDRELSLAIQTFQKTSIKDLETFLVINENEVTMAKSINKVEDFNELLSIFCKNIEHDDQSTQNLKKVNINELLELVLKRAVSQTRQPQSKNYIIDESNLQKLLDYIQKVDSKDLTTNLNKFNEKIITNLVVVLSRYYKLSLESKISSSTGAIPTKTSSSIWICILSIEKEIIQRLSQIPQIEFNFTQVVYIYNSLCIMGIHNTHLITKSILSHIQDSNKRKEITYKKTYYLIIESINHLLQGKHPKLQHKETLVNIIFTICSEWNLDNRLNLQQRRNFEELSLSNKVKLFSMLCELSVWLRISSNK